MGLCKNCFHIILLHCTDSDTVESSAFEMCIAVQYSQMNSALHSIKNVCLHVYLLFFVPCNGNLN